MYFCIINEMIMTALGNAFYNMIWFFNEGVMTAQDNLSAQAFGSRDHGVTICLSYFMIYLTDIACQYNVIP